MIPELLMLFPSHDPHEITIAASSPTTFAYFTQTQGSTGADTTSIVPGSYDVAGTVTAIPGAGKQATIQRVYLFPSGNIRVQYGQTIYTDLSTALQNVSSESFTINANVPGNGVLLATIVLRKDATDLSDPNQARILEASRFGEGNVGAGGQSVSTLQNAYDNSSTPEITVDSTRGAVTIQDNSVALGANLLEVTSNGGGTTYLGVDASSTTVLQLNADNIRLDGNTISTTNTNGDLTITPKAPCSPTTTT